jgi:dihydroorotase
MCHNPAILFQIKKRGYLKEGYYADVVIIDPNSPWTVDSNNILYKCGWSPFEGTTFRSKITHTILNGEIVYDSKGLKNIKAGKRLTFDR